MRVGTGLLDVTGRLALIPQGDKGADSMRSAIGAHFDEFALHVHTRPLTLLVCRTTLAAVIPSAERNARADWVRHVQVLRHAMEDPVRFETLIEDAMKHFQRHGRNGSLGFEAQSMGLGFEKARTLCSVCDPVTPANPAGSITGYRGAEHLMCSAQTCCDPALDLSVVTL